MKNPRPPYANELWHYGVKGMHWGIRRYQPYPKGHKGGQYLNVNKKTGTQNEGDLALALTAYAALTALELSVIGGAAIAASVSNKNAKKFEAKCEKEREAAPTDKKTGLKKQTQQLPEKENLKRVNPSYKDLDATGARDNCVNCTMAAEMRMRGYEVQAKHNATGRPGMKVGESYFKGVKTKEVQMPPKYNPNDQDEFLRYYDREERKTQALGGNKELAKKGIEAIRQYPPNSRGQICVRWNRNCGHSMMFQTDANGNARILDGQTGKIFDEKAAYKLLTRTCGIELQRLDNCAINTKAIKEGVR